MALRAHLEFRRVALAERIEPEVGDAALARLFLEARPKLADSEVRELNRDFDRAEAFAGEDEQALLRVCCCERRDVLTELERWTNDRVRALAVLRSTPAV